ncbi:DUF983 domain-containing protein [Ancylobacter lacus]|uniref:DUF983 domain-containing protein n=1 Tax=Ancylobacter lacus TaxID=2579970 RepID=UPI001BD03BF2|nr:DUF983 domain-containing protein [Ancylobacter lacus]MBS7541434.1 DUF983 domain-containing protein [Ancylobacter lacus]
MNTPRRSPPAPPRPMGQSIARGFRLRCPACGEGAMFGGYLKVNERCPACGEELWHHRADDAPPYAVITVVGHIIVPLVLAVEMAWHPPEWLHLAIWLPLTLVLSLLLLPPLKGALIGYQWAVRMHGFDRSSDEYDPVPPSRRAVQADAPIA